MILKSMNPVFGGWNGRAVIRNDPSMPSQRNPVLLIDGEPVSPGVTNLAELDVVKASKRELELFKKGGYVK